MTQSPANAGHTSKLLKKFKGILPHRSSQHAKQTKNKRGDSPQASTCDVDVAASESRQAPSQTSRSSDELNQSTRQTVPALPDASTTPKTEDFPKKPTSQEAAVKSTPIHKELWEKAYSELKNNKDKAKYVLEYENLISTVLLGSTSSDGGWDFGEEEMNKLCELGLSKIEKYKHAVEQSESTQRAIDCIKTIIDIPLKNIPQTTLPWAVVSSTVDIFIKPLKVGASLYNGVGYVVGRMEWFSSITDHLLSQNGNHGSLAAIHENIKSKILALYQSILFYQIKSVCFYHRKHQFAVLARGMFEIDDWDGDLQSIKDAEESLRGDCILHGLEVLKTQQVVIEMDQKTKTHLNLFHARLQAIRNVDPQSTLRTIQNSKEESIPDLYEWIFRTNEFNQFARWDQDAAHLLWVSGQAGTGKTMLSIGALREIQTRYKRENLLHDPLSLIYFFCQRTNDQLNTATAVLQSMVWMLLRQQPHLLCHLDAQFTSSGDKFIYDQNSVSTWFDILSDMLKDSGPVLVAIDALDECGPESINQVRRFLEHNIVREDLDHVKWFITSRPLFEIPESRSGMGFEKQELLILDDRNLPPSINTYIRQKMGALRKRAKNKERVDRIEHSLCERANNTFIWVALVTDKISSKPESSWEKILQRIPDNLNSLYGYLLEAIQSQDEDERDEILAVLDVTMMARRPLSLFEVEQLAGLDKGVNAGKDFAILCRSFLTLNGDRVQVFHQSAQDWYLDRVRRENGKLEGIHERIFQSSLQGLEEVLTENIYALPHYGVLSEEATAPEDDPLSPLRYSCQYWAYHLKESLLPLAGTLHHFLQSHFLHWVEAMALLGLLPETIHIINSLVSMIPAHVDVDTSDFLLDARRFIQAHFPAVNIAPLQLYVSALMFSPELSLVRNSVSIPSWIRTTPAMEKKWGPLIQTFAHADRRVEDVTFSPDNRLIAGAYRYGVRIWDRTSGTLLKELEGHNASIRRDGTYHERVIFSPDGGSLASSFSKRFLCLWDTTTWELTHEWSDTYDSVEYDPDRYFGHLGQILFSPDGQMLACGSNVGNMNVGLIRVWQQEASGWRLQWSFQVDIPNVSREKLDRHGGILRLSFSPDNLLLASSSFLLSTVFIWNLKTGSIHRKVSHASEVYNLAFSEGSESLLTVTENQFTTIHTWSVSSGYEKQSLQLCHPPSEMNHIRSSLESFMFDSIVFSHDTRQLASSHDKSIVVLNRDRGEIILETLSHEPLRVTIKFSSDGQMLASCGETAIRLWTVGPNLAFPSLPHHQSIIWKVAFSSNGSHVATIGWDGAKIWETATGLLISNIPGEPYLITVARFSPNGKILAVGGWGGALTAWNVDTGEVLVQKALDTSDDSNIDDIKFSSSGQLMGAFFETPPGYKRNEIEVWNTQKGHLEKTLSHEVLQTRQHRDLLNTLEMELGYMNMERTEGLENDSTLKHAQPSQGQFIEVDDDWIIIENQKSIWLPPEYRLPKSMDYTEPEKHVLEFHGDTLVMGCEGGRVLFFKFNLAEIVNAGPDLDDSIKLKASTSGY
ncbi:NACHT and WD40 domain protein [Penicillium herquei]|nr:NACHT and WD40 domain protein [Penicillium herquei]